MERDVVASLNELDALVDEARRRRDADATAGAATATQHPPPHLLPPARLVSAHLAPFVASEHAHATAALHALRADNGALAAELTAQRAQVEALVAELGRGVERVEELGALLGTAAAAAAAGEGMAA